MAPQPHSPELVAYARRRFEHTNDSIRSIAFACGLDEHTIRNMRDKQGWTRQAADPMRTIHDLNALLCAADSGDASDAACDAAQHSGLAANTPPPGSAASLAAYADQVESALKSALDQAEQMQTKSKNFPRSSANAARHARTLQILTETFHKLVQLRGALRQPSEFEDEMPKDIDEFRRELARRIEAFVASRADEDGCANPGAGTGSPPAGRPQQR